MHCEGWQCRTCGAHIYGECHHRSWCREDFCGVGPVLWVHEPEPVLPHRQAVGDCGVTPVAMGLRA
jgi:hypothetical protein